VTRPPLAAAGGMVLGRLPRPLADRVPAVAAEEIARAGLTTVIDGEQTRALRVGSTALLGGLGALAVALMPSPWVALAASGLAAFGWRQPDLWIAATAARRRERIERQAPALLDLVATTVAAGIPVDVALAGCAAAIGGPLAEEVGLTVANLALGRPRHEELHDLAARTAAPSVAALTLALRLSDRLGVPLAEALRRHALRMRVQRSRAVQERAARAGPKVLVVVVFVLVPAALVPVLTAVGLTAVGAAGSFGL